MIIENEACPYCDNTKKLKKDCTLMGKKLLKGDTCPLCMNENKSEKTKKTAVRRKKK